MVSTRTPDARASAAWLRRFARTTPGVVGLIAVVLAALCVIAGVVCAAQLDGRMVKRDDILDRSEPFAFAAQDLYAALSAADASAASAFLSGGIEIAPVRARYEQALADAASALADVAAGANGTQSRTAVADLTAQLGAYTGLVEAARANNRLGYPVGSAYLREASSLMQTTVLPGAEKIFKDNLATVDGDQRAVGSTSILALVSLGLVLAAIVVSSVIVFRRTNRQFNTGLVGAAVAVCLAGGWILVSTLLAGRAIDESRTDGTEVLGNLAGARILAQQARTGEILQLIERGDVTKSEQEFTGRIDQLTALLTNGPSAESDAVAAWKISHRKHVDAYVSGDYATAVQDAIGPGPDASPAHFGVVESSLRDQIEKARGTLRDRVSSAGHWLAFSPTGTFVLMMVAAAAAIVGLWPRLKEFL